MHDDRHGLTFNLTTDMGGAAFDAPGDELARILRLAADKLDRGHYSGKLRDINGNTVGRFGVNEDTGDPDTEPSYKMCVPA